MRSSYCQRGDGLYFWRGEEEEECTGYTMEFEMEAATAPETAWPRGGRSGEGMVVAMSKDSR
jgi:hypothetical protein